MKKILILTALCALVSTPAMANEPLAQGMSGQGYGTAGCGLGSIVFGQSPGLVQVLAATTNGTFGTQTFGITSGTSNCVDSGGGTYSAMAFVETNREAVLKDMARGSGETIKNLAALGGCSDEVAVGAHLQRNFGQIYNSAQLSDKQVSANVVQSLQNSDLQCKDLG